MKKTDVVQREGGVGQGWTGSLELADANYFIYIVDKQQGPTV